MRLAGRSVSSSSFLHNFARSSAFALNGLAVMVTAKNLDLIPENPCGWQVWHPISPSILCWRTHVGFSALVNNQSTDPLLLNFWGSIFWWWTKKNWSSKFLTIRISALVADQCIDFFVGFVFKISALRRCATHSFSLIQVHQSQLTRWQLVHRNCSTNNPWCTDMCRVPSRGAPILSTSPP